MIDNSQGGFGRVRVLAVVTVVALLTQLSAVAAAAGDSKSDSSSESSSDSSSDSLSAAVESFNAPANQAPGVISDKIYSVQDRFTPLKGRFETTVFAGQKINDTGFVESREAGLGLRYYLTSKWSLGANATFLSNKLSSTAERLMNQEGIVPDVPYVKSRADLSLRYNLFYGKFRVSMDRVMYFDQFISAGPALISLNTGDVYGGMFDIGLALWLGQNWTARLGFKDYIYSEPKGGQVNQAIFFVDAGFLFGRGA